MGLKIRIEDATVSKRSIPGKDGGAGFQVTSQTGILLAGRFVYPLNIRLAQEQAPYAPGEYLIDDESFGIDEYDNVSIRRGALKVKPLAAEAARRTPGAA